MTPVAANNHGEDLQDYLAADDEGEIFVAKTPAPEALSADSNGVASETVQDETPEITLALAAENSAQASPTFQPTGFPIFARTTTAKNEVLQEKRAATDHSDESVTDHYVAEGDRDLGELSVHRSETAENDVEQTTDYPMLDMPSSGQLSHNSQLQTMADLFHRHQLEQARQDVVRGADDGRDRAAPLQTQPAEGTSSTIVHVGDVNQSAPEVHGVDAVAPGLKDASRKLSLLSSHPAPATIPSALPPPSMILGKRKASSDLVEEAALSGPERHRLDEEIDECLGLDDLTTPSGKKKRRSRARKPQALPPSKVIGQALAQSPPVTSEGSPAPEPQIFKRETLRKWRRIDPYVAMMKVIMKERLKDGWPVMLNSIAEVTGDGEQKDIRVSPRMLNRIDLLPGS